MKKLITDADGQPTARLTFAGLSIAIESPTGSIRKGRDWQQLMANDYGYIEGATGADGDSVDVFLGRDPAAPNAYIVDQLNIATGDFDEHKVVLGAHSLLEAENVYRANYQEGWAGLGAITEVPLVPDFALWLQTGDMSAPYAPTLNTDGTSSSEPVCPKCGAMQEWNEDGVCNRCGTDKPPEMPGQATGDASQRTNENPNATSDSTEIEPDVFVGGDADFELLTDARKDGLLRVRQKAMYADRVNQNLRYYPRAVVQAAIDRARENVAAGVMLSEYVHPQIVASGGKPSYVDNHDRKTASVDAISDVGADGAVWITRTIKNTAQGRQIAHALRQSKPYGLSSRMRMKGHAATVDGQAVQIADALEIHTWDDVDNPAFDDAGRDFQLLTDSLTERLRAEHGLPALNTTTAESVYDTAPPARRTMNEKIKKALAHLKTQIALRKPVSEVNACYDSIIKLVEDSVNLGEDVTAAVDEMMTLQGYTSDRPGLTAIPGNGTGDDGKGSNADVAAGAEDIAGKAAQEAATIAARTTPVIDEKTQQAIDWLKSKQQAEESAASDAVRVAAIETACDTARATMGELASDEVEYILGRVRKFATTPESVTQLVVDELADYSKIAAKNRLAQQGYGARGNTTQATGGRVEVTARPPAYREQVDKLLAAADEVRKRSPNEFGKERVDPKRREYNRKTFIEPLVNEMAARRSASKSFEEYAALDSATQSGDEAAFCEAWDAAWSGASDATTLANVYNQPTIAEFMIYQTYQDMKMLQYVGGIGPRMDQNDGRGGFTLTGSVNNRTHVGAVLRIPSEFYQPPALGTGAGYQGTYDEGLFIAENQAIPEGVVTLNYLSYAPFSRRLGASIGRDARNSIGNGPLNYPLIARHIAHIGMHKERTIDKALADEMTLASDEFLAVQVVNEACVLANNSAYRAGGSVTVNLNPSKAANAAVAVGDPSVQYGANVIGAVRLMGRQGAAGGSGGNAAPYVGTVYGGDPVVPQRITKELVGVAGQYVTTVKNQISVSAPGAAILGGFDAVSRMVITALPSGQTATYGVDYNNGVLLFVSGVAGAAGAITTNVTASYSYATNYDNFQVNNVVLPAGVALETYLNGLMRQIDKTSALMGSIGRYVKPDFALMDLNVATNIIDASQFFNLNEVKDCEVFPTEDYFARRFGVDMARHNTPWNAFQNRIHVGRKETTRYGVDDAFGVEGPFPRYDPATGNLIDMQGYYGAEISVIATPQAIDNNGNVINAVSRAILMR